ncbi:TetR/AcrR family transcriptional regulator [Streptomyces fructofermentans]|uniref:TetR family transcriptional regulator n=1 Tax=Streptomyces fructofermentans TaxID=152141 RepID=A0A918NTM5_9ACTN|nr:TetR/AcrR family transcriptional regulator [Streptomyces fructofermentans]GGX94292.1 TetR family transcriptional regulator [Streptomyces fructofermentans]
MARPSLRENIVEAAVDRFHAHGYAATGVKDITDAAGAPKGSFYNHFESKEALAIVALERYGERRRFDMLRDESVAPLARLRQHFEFLRDENLDAGFTRGCMVGDLAVEVADHSEAVRAAVLTGFTYWREALTEAISAAQEAGDVSKAQEAATLASFVLNAWEGTLIATRTDRSARPFESFFTVVFGVILR